MICYEFGLYLFGASIQLADALEHNALVQQNELNVHEFNENLLFCVHKLHSSLWNSSKAPYISCRNHQKPSTFEEK